MSGKVGFSQLSKELLFLYGFNFIVSKNNKWNKFWKIFNSNSKKKNQERKKRKRQIKIYFKSSMTPFQNLLRLQMEKIHWKLNNLFYNRNKSFKKLFKRKEYNLNLFTKRLKMRIIQIEDFLFMRFTKIKAKEEAYAQIVKLKKVINRNTWQKINKRRKLLIKFFQFNQKKLLMK